MNIKTLIVFLTLILNISCLNQGKTPKIPGVTGPKLNINAGKILLTLELDNIDLTAGATLAIPKLNKSNITLTPKLEGGSIFQIAFDPTDVEGELFKVVPDSTLPNGQAFPFLIEGVLPALTVNIPKAYNTTFYASNKVFGFALPIKLPIEFNSSIHYRLKVNDKNVGIVSLISNENDRDKAFLTIILTLKTIVNNPEFKALLRYSKKYPTKVF